MDQSSFASEYRTAAILAAFSHVQDWTEARTLAVAHADCWAGWLGCRTVVSQFVRVHLLGRFSLGVAADRAARAVYERHPRRAWASRQLTMGSVPAEAASPRPLVSHFSFCEGSDLHGPGR